MSDFFQNGAITTLHRLTEDRVSEMEKELVSFSRQRPMGLVLPSLFSELEGPALKNMVDEMNMLQGEQGQIIELIVNRQAA